MATSPSTDNYYIGKGIVSVINITASETEYRDVGDVPLFELEPTGTDLDHFSSRGGVRVKDKSIQTDKSLTLRMQMDEVTGPNLALFLNGLAETDTAGNTRIPLMTQSSIRCRVRFRGTNDVGMQLNFDGLVDFKPSGTLGLITEEWGNCTVEGEVVSENGSLGVITIEDVTESLTGE